MKKHKSPERPASGKTPARANQPIKRKEEVQRSKDEHIDQDLPGYPHHPSKENTISNGSAGAFASTENTRDDVDSDEDNDDLALNRSSD
jgi:hypothetical protein